MICSESAPRTVVVVKNIFSDCLITVGNLINQACAPFFGVDPLYATYLLSNNADLSSVSALLGHSSTKMTADVYCHSQKSEKKRAVSLLPEL